MARFWFQRTERTRACLLTEELKADRLRQGWGSLPEQDLRIISAAREQGLPLSEYQRQCWRRNRRLLPTEPDGVRPEDYIITPHLPEKGVWSIVKVTGGYSYEILHIPPDVRDFGHILKVELINPDRPINPKCAAVAAGLRESARNLLPMWNVDHLAEQVRRLIDAIERGNDVSQPETETERLASIYRLAATAIEDGLRERFEGAEFEKPVKMLLDRIYGEGNVETHAGPREHGADFVFSYTDGLRIQHKVAVQVKMFRGTVASLDPLDQIRRAHENYEGIDEGVILTMAEDFEEDFEARREDLERELSIPIHLLSSKEVVDLFMKHLPDLVLD